MFVKYQKLIDTSECKSDKIQQWNMQRASSTYVYGLKDNKIQIYLKILNN